MRKKRIALFGGAFNPPHNGHSAVIKTLDSFDGIDEVWLMPSANRWDKSISVSGPDRLHMIDLMIDDEHFRSRKPIRAFDHEVRKPNLSTTYETKAELEKLYPYHEFHFVCGSDIIPDIEAKWVNGKELFATCNFIFIDRPGHTKASDVVMPKKYTVVPIVSSALSSTYVRSVAKDKEKLLKCVSPSVAEFIASHNLYQK
jgi:nicotinate-nucleotide adenylyltransferase